MTIGGRAAVTVFKADQRAYRERLDARETDDLVKLHAFLKANRFPEDRALKLDMVEEVLHGRDMPGVS